MQSAEVTVADGRVESVRDGVVTGWAWSPPAPDVRVGILVWVDGRIAATGRADQHAPGLAEVGIGDGHHAFQIALPEELATQEEHAVAVRVAGVSERLSMLRGWNEQGEGPWSATRLVADDRPEPPPPLADDPAPSGAEPAAAAVTGRGGWRFAHGHGATTRANLQEVARQLEGTASALAELGIRYVAALAPAKLVVYPDRVLRPAVAPTGAGQALTRLARDSDVLDVVDLTEVLSHARRYGDVHLPQDERWSALGGLHVQRALVKRAGVPGLRPTPLARARFAGTLEPPPADLAPLPVVGPSEDGVEPEAPLGIDPATLRSQRVPAASHLDADGHVAPRVYERADAGDLPRAVLVGDPSAQALAPWLAEVTSRLVVFAQPEAPLVPIELEHPAVVFHVLEERRIGP